MPGCLLSTQSVIVAYLSVHCFRPIHQIFTTHSGHEIRGGCVSISEQNSTRDDDGLNVIPIPPEVAVLKCREGLTVNNNF